MIGELNTCYVKNFSANYYFALYIQRKMVTVARFLIMFCSILGGEER